MKSELPAYLELVSQIKPLEQRRDSKTRKDTFSLKEWWAGNSEKIPSWAFVLRAVLTNSPNSIPPERVVSILNDTFDDDQGNAMADYKELSLKKQFDERSRKKERGE